MNCREGGGDKQVTKKGNGKNRTGNEVTDETKT